MALLSFLVLKMFLYSSQLELEYRRIPVNRFNCCRKCTKIHDDMKMFWRKALDKGHGFSDGPTWCWNVVPSLAKEHADGWNGRVFWTIGKQNALHLTDLTFSVTRIQHATPLLEGSMNFFGHEILQPTYNHRIDLDDSSHRPSISRIHTDPNFAAPCSQWANGMLPWMPFSSQMAAAIARSQSLGTTIATSSPWRYLVDVQAQHIHTKE